MFICVYVYISCMKYIYNIYKYTYMKMSVSMICLYTVRSFSNIVKLNQNLDGNYNFLID